jgi:hypothetical protein
MRQVKSIAGIRISYKNLKLKIATLTELMEGLFFVIWCNRDFFSYQTD